MTQKFEAHLGIDVVIVELEGLGSVIIDGSDNDIEIRVWPEDENAFEPVGVMRIPLSMLRETE